MSIHFIISIDIISLFILQFMGEVNIPFPWACLVVWSRDGSLYVNNSYIYIILISYFGVAYSKWFVGMICSNVLCDFGNTMPIQISLLLFPLCSRHQRPSLTAKWKSVSSQGREISCSAWLWIINNNFFKGARLAFTTFVVYLKTDLKRFQR